MNGSLPTVWDAIVIGAGPAGTCAARKVAAAGFSVLVVERREEIGKPVRCGELIRTSSLAAIADLQAPWITRRFSAYEIRGPFGARARFEGKDLGRMIDRVQFDSYLADVATEAGARVELATDVEGVSRVGARFRVAVRGPQNRVELHARVVIAADGVASRAARWLGLKSAGSVRTVAAAAFGVLTGPSLEEAVPSIRFGSDLAPGGYAWLFPIDGGKANIGIGCDASKSRVSVRDALLSYAAQCAPGTRVEKIRAGAIPIGGPLSRPVAEGVIAVGDAARHSNPLTGAGIAPAVSSGLLGGTAVAEALMEGDLSATKLSVFNDEWKARHEVFHMKSLMVRRFLNRLDDRRLDSAIARLAGTNMHYSVGDDMSRIWDQARRL